MDVEEREMRFDVFLLFRGELNVCVIKIRDRAENVTR